MSRKWLTIGGALLAVLVVAVIWWASHGDSGEEVGTGAGPAHVRNPIKVGMILSHETANAPGWKGKPWGYDPQLKILPMIEEADIQLYPILEPGFEGDKQLQVQLNAQFPGKTAIDGTNPAKLREMKVIVAWGVLHTSEDLLEAVASVVEKDGVGLLHGQGLAAHKIDIGSDDTLLQLSGMTRAEYAGYEGWADCSVVTEHPLLGDLSGRTKETFKLSPNGYYGVLPEGATPLVKMVDQNDLQTWGYRRRNRPEYVAYPVYLSSLGKGRIVGCAVGPNDPMTALQTATGGKFFVRCLRWLANEPLD